MRAATYLQGLLKDVVSAQGWEWPDKAGVEPPRDKKFGDLASNVAMMLAGQAGQKPREVAEVIRAGVLERAGESEQANGHTGDIRSVDIAGPGFLNFTFAPAFWQRGLVSVLEHGPRVPDVGQGEKVQIEYVSANPTGPLHVGHGRGAALGDALARIMERAGYDVQCEYYVNDAGRQTMLLGLSILYRLQQAKGMDPAEPEDYYRGDYIKDLAAKVAEAHPDILDTDPEEALATARDMGMALVIETIKDDLAAFNVRHDVWFSEKSLVTSGKVQETFDDLKARGMAYEADGALWFKSTELGDDKDRVLIKSSGDITYFASDIAYHDNKFKRGFERVVNIWGADHHGYVPRMQAAAAALGHEGKLDVILVQLVNLLRGGEPVSMGKRSGSFETLRDLIDEVGPEAARFIFLTRKSDSKLDFDLDVVKQRSMDNPVYYVQYAHARIHSVFAKACDEGLECTVAEPPRGQTDALTEPEELDLLKFLDQYEDAVAGAASGVSPHLVGYYLQELASALHKYYTVHHVLTAGPEVRDARLMLLAGVARVLAEGLALLGVSAPKSM